MIFTLEIVEFGRLGEVSFREGTQENKTEEILKECSAECQDKLLLW